MAEVCRLRTNGGHGFSDHGLKPGIGSERLLKGINILVPAMTFVSTATATLYCGMETDSVEVCEDRPCMDLSDLERKVDKHCIVLMPVHLSGHPVEIDKLLGIASEYISKE